MTQIVNPVAFQVFHDRARSIYDGMRRRAKKEHLRLEFNVETFEAWLLERFAGGPEGTVRCFYSGQVLSAENFFIDHTQPIGRGGDFRLGNLVMCSEAENLRKGDLSAREYFKLRAFVEMLHPSAQASIWRRLQVGDVQRQSYFRRKKKCQTQSSN